ISGEMRHARLEICSKWWIPAHDLYSTASHEQVALAPKTRPGTTAVPSHTTKKRVPPEAKDSTYTFNSSGISLQNLGEGGDSGSSLRAHVPVLYPHSYFSGNCCSEQRKSSKYCWWCTLCREDMNVPGWLTGLDLLSPVVEIHMGCPATFFGP